MILIYLVKTGSYNLYETLVMLLWCQLTCLYIRRLLPHPIYCTHLFNTVSKPTKTILIYMVFDQITKSRVFLSYRLFNLLINSKNKVIAYNGPWNTKKYMMHALWYVFSQKDFHKTMSCKRNPISVRWLSLSIAISLFSELSGAALCTISTIKHFTHGPLCM